MAKAFVTGVGRGADPTEAIQRTLKKTGLGWLKKGQTVLLKPALNSADPYPATTHPLTIKVVAQALEDKGAKVIVGDQSGVERVFQTKNGAIRGSSRKCYNNSGMADSGMRFTAFEEHGWHAYTKHHGPSWTEGFYIANAVEQADHVISLPRLSTHAQAGVTLGFKNMVGILRDDSRMEFHSNGPFYDSMKKMSDGHGVREDGTGKFFEKMVEISLAVRKKLRLTLFTGTKAQVTFGPDREIVQFIGGSHVVEPDTGLIIASRDQVAAEVAALAFLTHLYETAPVHRKALQKVLVRANGVIRELGEESVWANPFVDYALEMKLGKKDFSVEYDSVPTELQNALSALISKR